MQQADIQFELDDLPAQTFYYTPPKMLPEFQFDSNFLSINKENALDLLIVAGASGDTKLFNYVREFIRTINIEDYNINQALMQTIILSLENNHLEFVAELYNNSGLGNIRVAPYGVRYIDNDKSVWLNVFVYLCENGYLQSAQYIHQLVSPTFEDVDLLFVKICARNQLEVAQWLIQTYNIDHEYRNHCALETSINNNCTNVVNWLNQSVYNIISAAKSNDISLIMANSWPLYRSVAVVSFQIACVNDNIDIATYIHSNSEFINEELIKQSFIASCKNGSVRVFKWLLELIEVVNDNIDQAVYILCRKIITYKKITKSRSKLQPTLDAYTDCLEHLIEKSDATKLGHLINCLYKCSNLTAVEYVIRYFSITEIEIDEVYRENFQQLVKRIFNMSHKSAQKI